MSANRDSTTFCRNPGLQVCLPLGQTFSNGPCDQRVLGECRAPRGRSPAFARPNVQGREYGDQKTALDKNQNHAGFGGTTVLGLPPYDDGIIIMISSSCV